jgi:putative SOS response-associated peptidase YedK
MGLSDSRQIANRQRQNRNSSRKTNLQRSLEKRRCIIPASWYFEWEHLISNSGQKKTGDKYMIQPNGSSMTWLAGLYRIEDSLPVFTVLTREPTDELRRIHDRMPLIFPKERIDEWIDPRSNPEELLRYAMTDMVMEKAI